MQGDELTKPAFWSAARDMIIWKIYAGETFIIFSLDLCQTVCGSKTSQAAAAAHV